VPRYLVIRAAVALILSLASLTSISIQSANAAVGDTDTYLNLESNTSQFAIATDSAGFTISNAITMEAWVKPDATCLAAAECEILNKENSYTIGLTSGVYSYALFGSNWAWEVTGISGIAGVWQHVALTRNANTNTAYFYLNGVLASTGTAQGAGSGSIADSGLNFVVGARTGGSANSTSAAAYSYFTGSIDEIKVWRTARTQTQIRSDMSTYGPTNEADLRLYYDFNDASGSIVNKALGADASTTLTLRNSPGFTSIETTVVDGATKTVTFPRTYLSANGFKVPAGITSIDAMVIGGGGGGGSNLAGGGSGGGGYMVTGLATTAGTSIPVRVGFGGQGGRNAAARLQTYDGTVLMNGQSGDSSTVTINGTTYIGGGGGGGPTYWTSLFCAGSTGAQTVWATAGQFSGAGGTGNLGGIGAPPSQTQNLANGRSGYSFNITGSNVIYGSGGGAGGDTGVWKNGVGGDSSLGGNGGTSAGNGTNLRGAGGGGGYSSCYAGGRGGSGVVVLRFGAYTAEFTTGVNSTAIYRTATSLVVTVNSIGKVSFYANNKLIPGCIKVPTVSAVSITSTCSWRPSNRGMISISARFAPAASPSSVLNLSAGNIRVGNRSGIR